MVSDVTDLRDVSDEERRSIQDARKMQGLSNSSEVDYLVGDESEAQRASRLRNIIEVGSEFDPIYVPEGQALGGYVNGELLPGADN